MMIWSEFVMTLALIVATSAITSMTTVYLMSPRQTKPEPVMGMPEDKSPFMGNNGLYTNKVLSTKKEDDDDKHIRG